MPANIAHMLICNKAVKVLQDGGEYQQFIDVLDFEINKPFLNLGSVGPDLSYYESQIDGFINLIIKKTDKPLGVDGWSYYLHSKDPNRFPLTLTELTWRDTRWEEQEWKDEDFPKFAFTCGYLSHVAADQIIHPMVNEIAGPYYRKGKSRSLHRECEIYQDVALFYSLYDSEDFIKRKFNRWADINPHSHVNTEDWFRYFIQRAFAECHSVYPGEQNIENWVDGLLFTLRIMKWPFSPYRKAYQEYKESGLDGEKFKKYFSGYMDLFFNAVELTSIYWKALFELYEPTDNVLEISDPMRKRFLNIVQNADLSSPLEKDILQKAKDALLSTDDSRLKRLVASAINPLDQKKVKEIKQEDVSRFG
ncbi:MAG TPA: zinc dependent phospholipase C family protein [Thermodesulfobacteriota bacterium]|jgi:hypothetical protein|nr:zinc dependent phospholipase C family protein [Thermodesulfobacteriota bacterium]